MYTATLIVDLNLEEMNLLRYFHIILYFLVQIVSSASTEVEKDEVFPLFMIVRSKTMRS